MFTKTSTNRIQHIENDKISVSDAKMIHLVKQNNFNEGLTRHKLVKDFFSMKTTEQEYVNQQIYLWFVALACMEWVLLLQIWLFDGMYKIGK